VTGHFSNASRDQLPHDFAVNGFRFADLELRLCRPYTWLYTSQFLPVLETSLLIFEEDPQHIVTYVQMETARYPHGLLLLEGFRLGIYIVNKHWTVYCGELGP